MTNVRGTACVAHWGERVIGRGVPCPGDPRPPSGFGTPCQASMSWKPSWFPPHSCQRLFSVLSCTHSHEEAPAAAGEAAWRAIRECQDLSRKVIQIRRRGGAFSLVGTN